MKRTFLPIIAALALAWTLAGCGGSPAKHAKNKARDTGGKTTATSAAPSTPAAAPAPPARLSDQDSKIVVAEHSLGYWMEALNSSKKDTVIEAISALTQPDARAHAHAAVAKLTELSKSPDKDIASEAAEALKVIK